MNKKNRKSKNRLECKPSLCRTNKSLDERTNERTNERVNKRTNQERKEESLARGELSKGVGPVVRQKGGMKGGRGEGCSKRRRKRERRERSVGGRE